MPSGAHSGRAGSHGGITRGGSSRGSSFGGSSRKSSPYGRSSSSHGHFHMRPRGPRMIHFGRRVYVVTSARQTLLSIMFFVGLILVLGLVINFSTLDSFKEQKQMIEEEHRYYIAMVETAQSDSRYVADAEVFAQWYEPDYERWYVEYKFKTANGGTVKGYTFSIYTGANKPAKGPIKIAVDDLVITSDTDSIPMDYVNFTLEDDGEYMMVKKTISRATGKIVMFFLLIAGAVGGGILLIVTSKKKEEEKQEAEKAEQKAKDEAEEKKRFCEYCGARVEPSDSVCPQCGARLR